MVLASALLGGLAVMALAASPERAMSERPAKPATEATPRAFDAVFSHHKVDVHGVRLHYVKGGHGPPVVLLHGWAETWTTWRRVMPQLAAAGYTVIAPDLRGIGDSDRPPQGYDKKTIATEVAAMMRQLGYTRFDVAGHDLGAQVAYALARFHADHIAAVAVLDAPVAGIPPWDELRSNPRLWHWTFYNVPDLPEALIGGRERLYFSWFYRQIAVNTPAAEADLDDVVDAYSRPGALRAGLAYFRAFDQDTRDNAGYAQDQLLMPVLALGASGGNGDIPLRQMRLAGPNVEGGVIEDCGHWIPSERPAELAARLIAFFARANGGGPAPLPSR
jgi:pimeloyl-ACP methyl ester carboxylesterase